MLINLRGRVESDPMMVPVAATMTTGRDSAFESVLQQAVDAEVEPATEPATTREEPPADEPAPVEPQADETRPEGDELPAGGNEAEADPLATSHAVVAEGEVTESVRRGEPERLETAGKAADATRPAQRTAEPLLAAAIAHGATQSNGPLVAGKALAVQGVAGAKAGADAPAGGVAGSWARAAASLRTPAVAAGYRTTSAASAELLEHARDSVFKQILMKLTSDGGEMRMRLDPPDLGELDLRLVVEGGNKLSLSIATERADLTQLIQRHLDELKQSLQSAGLEVTDAQVHTRDGQSRGQRHDAHHGFGGDDADEAKPTNGPRRGGYVTAEGLDFWV